ncbi:hypothetical protein CCHL11_03312 [Colletotrichum chlorophyti]|uniref:Uncharacterized protein n=1 Tax=Colletotrichum chlorophyti TaxID=708187 RepID=A0A1Q8S422_9PEZI|nr:hypothetical protein CCHL11_03312 [Colletotrichum chlorophyti]
MADPFPTPTATPKRKRDEELPLSPICTTSKFSFQLPDAKSDEDGSASPHSKVVQKFRGLALSGGGGVAQRQNTKGPYDSARDSEYNYDDDPFASRKRVKILDLEMADALADFSGPVVVPESDVKSDPAPAAIVEEIVPPATTIATTAPAGDQRSHPPLERLQEPRSRGRRRAGIPQLKGRRAKIGDAQDDESHVKIVDPVRAALTWKEEEITVYDPEDEDDDGTGINGVGFMPTAAMAYARTQKRRLQLAEYKKREESEARARRSQRRRGSGAGLGAKLDSKSTGGVRKVRFIESEPNTVVTNG